MKNLYLFAFKFTEVLMVPFTLLSIYWFRVIRRVGILRAVVSEKMFMMGGMYPLVDHYYDPLFNPEKYLDKAKRENRVLTGIDMNDQLQLSVLKRFDYNGELLMFPMVKRDKLEYAYDNTSFKSGDSEYLYNIIRSFKPGKIVEVGSGNSTLMVSAALRKNKADDDSYACEHICIEPYEQPWLERLNAKVIRKKVEDIDLSFFASLNENDILFIDSSHMIRPQGDVLYEFLSILPILKSGVLVHIHDIFTPNDYPNEWFSKHHLFLNEQYLLEGFLMFNKEYEVIGALNYLSHHYTSEFSEKCPVFGQEDGREPASFWLRRK